MSLSRNGKSIIGIMGLGVVGEAVKRYFEGKGNALRCYDPYRQTGSEASINEADVVFVCVPTPFRPGVGFDDGSIEEAVSALQGSKVIVIKSTVLPGTTEAFQYRYPQHCFLFNPEFLRQATAAQDFVEPDRQVVGYTAQSRHLAEAVLALLPRAPFARVLPAREAEMVKYMTNAFLAVKVTFANEIYDLCSALDIDYDTVREGVGADARIGASHLDVLEGGYRGYGGACLPKDTKSLLELGQRLHVPMRLLQTADRVNASLLPPGDETPALRPVRPEPVAGEDEEPAAEQAA